MTETPEIGSRGGALVLLFAGLLILLLSFQTWGSCPTTPCGGMLLSFSHYSGIDLGFGVVTGLGGLMLAAIGLDGLRHNGVSRFATAAVLLALVIVLTTGASVVWMYVIPGDDKDFRWPPVMAILVAFVGLIAVAASLRLRASATEEKSQPVG
jgi:hypothetical protein